MTTFVKKICDVCGSDVPTGAESTGVLSVRVSDSIVVGPTRTLDLCSACVEWVLMSSRVRRAG